LRNGTTVGGTARGAIADCGLRIRSFAKTTEHKADWQILGEQIWGLLAKALRVTGLDDGVESIKKIP
jgi:hypothetical protein